MGVELLTVRQATVSILIAGRMIDQIPEKGRSRFAPTIANVAADHLAESNHPLEAFVALLNVLEQETDLEKNISKETKQYLQQALENRFQVKQCALTPQPFLDE